MYKKVKILVAEITYSFSIKISRYLNNKEGCNAQSLKNCCEMNKLYAKIEEYEPNVVVFHAGLFKGDIIRFMQKVNNKYPKLHFIVLLPYMNKRLSELIVKTGACCITMPFELHEIYEEIMIKHNFSECVMEIDKIRYFIQNIGLNKNLKGFDYICTAIYITLFESDKFKLLTKDIYPEIARRHKENYKNIERCIRNSINVFMKNNKNKNYIYDRIKADNPSVIDPKIKIEDFKFTNSKFIKIMAEEFRCYHMPK